MEISKKESKEKKESPRNLWKEVDADKHRVNANLKITIIMILPNLNNSNDFICFKSFMLQFLLLIQLLNQE